MGPELFQLMPNRPKTNPLVLRVGAVYDRAYTGETLRPPHSLGQTGISRQAKKCGHTFIVSTDQKRKN